MVASDNIVRDFITPPDFYNLIQAVIDYKSIKKPLDCFTQSPVPKFDLLADLESKFGLKYRIDQSVDIIKTTGIKINYYSTNKIAKSIGYSPKNTSIDGIIKEINKLQW